MTFKPPNRSCLILMTAVVMVTTWLLVSGQEHFCWWKRFNSFKYSLFYGGKGAMGLAKQGRDKPDKPLFRNNRSSFPSFTRRSPESEDILNHLQQSPEDLLRNIMLNRTQLSAGPEAAPA